MFEVGQKVWCVIFGEGVVTKIITDNTQFRVEVHFGEVPEYYTLGGKYRLDGLQTLYPYPVEIVKKSVRQVVKPSINWEQVREEYKFLARDENNTAWLYQEEPEICREGWGVTRGVPAEAGSYVSYTPGTCDWKDSLVERP